MPNITTDHAITYTNKVKGENTWLLRAGTKPFLAKVGTGILHRLPD